MAELSALADGTLPADRRAEVEARVAASPELQELVERQR
jgi:anti-sigma factor RsiW